MDSNDLKFFFTTFLKGILVFPVVIFLFWPQNIPYWIGVLLVLIMAFILAFCQTLMERKTRKAEEDKRRLREEEKKRAEETLNNDIKQLVNKYGHLSNTIRLEQENDLANIKDCLLVFGESKILYISGRALLFKDIISYNITDDYSIKHGEVKYTSKTSTSTGSLIGRSVTGAVLTGGVGAVIGASSASKDTTTIGIQDNDTIIHKYALSINIKSMESPLIRIDIGGSTKKAEEINAVLACIMVSKEA